MVIQLSLFVWRSGKCARAFASFLVDLSWELYPARPDVPYQRKRKGQRQQSKKRGLFPSEKGRHQASAVKRGKQARKKPPGRSKARRLMDEIGTAVATQAAVAPGGAGATATAKAGGSAKTPKAPKAPAKKKPAQPRAKKTPAATDQPKKVAAKKRATTTPKGGTGGDISSTYGAAGWSCMLNTGVCGLLRIQGGRESRPLRRPLLRKRLPAVTAERSRPPRRWSCANSTCSNCTFF